MPIFDTPIHTNDASLSKVLGQKQPVLMVLHEAQLDKPLQDALNKAAKKYAGDLLIVYVDAAASPQAHAQYGSPATPALVTLTGGNHGRSVKSQAERVRPSDVRAHIAHLLKDAPLPSKNDHNGNGKAQAHSDKPVVVNDNNFRKEVLKSKLPVLVDFWAPWCGPCRTIAPHVERMAREYKGKVKFVKLDTDQNPVMAQRFQIRSIPTFILFEGGQPAQRISGANPAAIRQIVQNAAH